MILNAILFSNLLCPPTQIINHTDKWTVNDQKTYVTAKKTCKNYYKDTPCLVKLIKKDTYTFNAICGKAKNE